MCRRAAATHLFILSIPQILLSRPSACSILLRALRVSVANAFSKPEKLLAIGHSIVYGHTYTTPIILGHSRSLTTQTPTIDCATDARPAKNFAGKGPSVQNTGGEFWTAGVSRRGLPHGLCKSPRVLPAPFAGGDCKTAAFTTRLARN
jgi:hypothetical protein